MSEIKTTYREIEISYNEVTNTWRASGYRNKVSLDEMRKAIDRQLDKPEKEKFTPVKAIRLDYGRPEVVTVTSLPEDGGIWFTNNKSERAKDSHFSKNKYFILDEASLKSLNDWQDLEKQVSELREKQSKIVATFQQLALKIQA